MVTRKNHLSEASTVDMGSLGMAEGEQGQAALARYMHDNTTYRLLVSIGAEVESHALPKLGPVTLGRTDDNSISIPSEAVSRRHAVLTMGPQFSLTDLDSRNRVRIEDKALNENEMTPLHPGQTFTMGPVALVVQATGIFDDLLTLFEKRRASKPGGSFGSSTDNEISPVPQYPKSSWHHAPLLGLFFGGNLSTRILPRMLRLIGESSLMGILLIYLSLILGWQDNGVISVFLMAVVFTERFNHLVQENTRLASQGGRSSGQIHRLTALSLLSVFIGIFIAFCAAALWLGEAGIEQSYGFAFKETGVGDAAIGQRAFGLFGPLVAHNLAVAFTIALMSVLFRGYGALLTMSWNACLWGLVLTTMILRGLSQSDLDAPVFIGISAIALMPHLITEALAYVLSCLSGVYAAERVFAGSQKAIGVNSHSMLVKLVMATFFFVIMGAAFEAFFLPRILALL
jgi:hypothetical protein